MKHKSVALSKLAPVLGAGAIGACPVCWLGSASLLTYLGLGALIPAWPFFAIIILGFGAIGFLLDFRSHKNVFPLAVLVLGSGLLIVGRYILGGEGFDGWPIWGSGALLISVGIFLNKKQFSKKLIHANKQQI